jgi:hypothetical protein
MYVNNSCLFKQTDEIINSVVKMSNFNVKLSGSYGDYYDSRVI